MRLPLSQFLLGLRDAYITKLSATKEGIEHLDKCWMLTQTTPDRDKLREKFRKGGR